jgi:hypothetical protein
MENWREFGVKISDFLEKGNKKCNWSGKLKLPESLYLLGF